MMKTEYKAVYSNTRRVFYIGHRMSLFHKGKAVNNNLSKLITT